MRYLVIKDRVSQDIAHAIVYDCKTSRLRRHVVRDTTDVITTEDVVRDTIPFTIDSKVVN